jgi:NADPH:quinone reductase-like Zn-dependent oxidoreductase
VGEVVGLGEGCSRFSAGERLIPIFAQRWLDGRPTREILRSTLGGPLDGTLQEEMVLDETGLVRAPEHLTDEEAATLPCAGVTAWNAIEPLRPGGTLLVLGTGGVATFALQLACARGARVIVISSSDEKLERATRLGAATTLNYRSQPEWGRAVRRLTDGQGVDLVVEVGGAETLVRSIEAVGFGGQISLIGNLTGASVALDLIPLFMRRIRLEGILVGSRRSFEALNRAIVEHRIRPVVDRTFSMIETRAAIDHLTTGGHLGKVCIRVRENR